jgi:hypothetical protein
LYFLSFSRFPLTIILFVLLSFSFDHYIVCPFVVFLWPRQKDKQYNGQRKTTKRTNNVMAKGKRQKNKQYNGHRRNEKRTNNIMATGKRPLYYMSFCRFPLIIILFVLFSFLLWPLYCLSFCCFPLAIILFVLLSFSFGHYIVCPFVVFLWPL